MAFVTKKITDGVNKLLSFFCLILFWCVCIIFSKNCLVTSHFAFSTRFDFKLEIYHVDKSTDQRRAFTLSPVSWFSEQHKSKTPGWSVWQCSGDVSLVNEYKMNYRHMHRTHYMIHISESNLELAGTQSNLEKGQRHDDFQGNDGPYIGDWLNTVYFSKTSHVKASPLSERTVCACSIYWNAVLCFMLF